MKKLATILFAILAVAASGQTSKNANEEKLITEVLIDPTAREIKEILVELRKKDLSPKSVVVHDTTALSNGNTLYVLSHIVEGKVHYGAVVLPSTRAKGSLPVVLFATGGDGMTKEFDIRDFNHDAAQFPSFLGKELDQKFIVVIPSFRGQQLIIGDKKYQSEGSVTDAFGGATTDALALLNVVLKTFKQADNKRIATYGGSRGAAVALLAAERDKRIKRVVAVAAPTDMKALYQLYPEQFRLLFFNDLLAAKITPGEARKHFLSISPIYFSQELPLVQLHHDKNDPFVPVAFANTLVERMKSNGKPIDAYFYNEGIHGFWADPQFWKRVEEFLRPLSE